MRGILLVREHGEHARCLFGGGGIDRNDPAVRDRAVDDCRVDEALAGNLPCSARRRSP